ncbi:MAG: hypothetical protein CME06_17090 [Gemmatimonadetes bacterium]|nr:hypothetical protein [Gemmatimonadota bacterium]
MKKLVVFAPNLAALLLAGAAFSFSLDSSVDLLEAEVDPPTACEQIEYSLWNRNQGSAVIVTLVITRAWDIDDAETPRALAEVRLDPGERRHLLRTCLNNGCGHEPEVITLELRRVRSGGMGN